MSVGLGVSGTDSWQAGGPPKLLAAQGRYSDLRLTKAVGRAYLPDHFAFRLPRNAEMPSRASSDVNAVTKPPFSASIHSSRSPVAETCLICSTATGAWPASLRAHARAVSK